MNQIILQDHTIWQHHFSMPAARQSFDDHIAALPSSLTPEQHTLHVYASGLDVFIDWLAGRMPTEDIMGSFIAHLKKKGLKSSTISSKYLAPSRLFLRKLAAQNIDIQNISGGDWIFIDYTRQHIRDAAAVPSPKPDTTSNRPALYQHGNRISLSQQEDILNTIDQTTLNGQRDLALLFLGFTSAMRLAELQRLSLQDIKPGKDCWELHVRGKRNTIDPVPVDSTAVNLIRAYVAAFNAALPADDPRYIQDDDPVWQPLTSSGKYFDTGQKVGRGVYRGSFKGLSTRAIASIVSSRAKSAIDIKFSTHDMRRSAAALGRDNGMSYDELKVLLRHKSIATTALYVGNPPKMSTSLITNHVTFNINIQGVQS